jgi:hypothetical protein
MSLLLVIPAKAGIPLVLQGSWTPAFAGVTMELQA